MERTARDRREAIADAAIGIVADQGIRALTHRAVDARLDLPAGSCSYYFRTKRTLLQAVVKRLKDVSRQAFADSPLSTSASDDPAALGRDIARWLDDLLLRRRNDLTVRYALTLELRDDEELHQTLAASLFSRDGAVTLFRALGAADPEMAGANFVSLVEGLVFDRFAGTRSRDGLEPGSAESVDQLAAALTAYIRGATG